MKILLAEKFQRKLISRGDGAPSATASEMLVGVRGLEPPASTSRTWRASQLRYTPKFSLNENPMSFKNLEAPLFLIFNSREAASALELDSNLVIKIHGTPFLVAITLPALWRFNLFSTSSDCPV